MATSTSPTLLYEDARGVIVRSHGSMPQAAGRLLDATEWGSEGVRFIVNGRGTSVGERRGVHVLTLERAGETLGMYALRERPLKIGTRQCRAFYRGLVSVAPAAGGAGLGRILFEAARDFALSGPTPTLSYGFIESDNSRSLKLARRVGYRPIGEFVTVMLSRVRPSEDPRVRRLKPAERPELAERLRGLWGDHGLLSLEHSLEDPHVAADLWALEERGRIRAACFVERRHFTMTHMPGLSGLLIRRVLSRTPLLRRIMPASDFPFLQMGAPWCRPGDERALIRLWEALLAREGRHVAMLYLDPASPLTARLEATRRLGVLDRVATRARALVMAGAHGIPEAELDALSRRPLWVSPLDLL